MGASNSKPQSVHITNPAPFQITRDVMERIEKATKPKTIEKAIFCEHCKRIVEPVQQSTAAANAAALLQHQHHQMALTLQRRSNEIEESQFGKTVERVHKLFGQPVKWAKECNSESEIKELERKLSACYRDYGSEPLKCEPLAKQYHHFVFSKHSAAMNTIQPKPVRKAGAEKDGI